MACAVNIAGIQTLDRVPIPSLPCAWKYIRAGLFGCPNLSTALHGIAQGHSKKGCTEVIWQREAPHPGCGQTDNPEPESSAQGAPTLPHERCGAKKGKRIKEVGQHGAKKLSSGKGRVLETRAMNRHSLIERISFCKWLVTVGAFPHCGRSLLKVKLILQGFSRGLPWEGRCSTWGSTLT